MKRVSSLENQPNPQYTSTMTADNFNRMLRAFQRRTPFRPFMVELVSGFQFQVDHPEALVFRDGVAVHVAPGGAITLFDHEGVRQISDATSAQTPG
jgi:hypothetical protein